MRNYTFLLAFDPAVWNRATEEQQQQWADDHGRFEEQVDRIGRRLGGGALDGASTATTVRQQGDRVTVTDGPFVELTEQLGGYYTIALPSLDVAIEAASLLPDCYVVEIRPMVDL